jgi:hypothetical protein
VREREREREKQRNVIQTQKVSTPTDNLETGQPFKHNIQRSRFINLLLKVSGGAVLSEKIIVSI